MGMAVTNVSAALEPMLRRTTSVESALREANELVKPGRFTNRVKIISTAEYAARLGVAANWAAVARDDAARGAASIGDTGLVRRAALIKIGDLHKRYLETH